MIIFLGTQYLFYFVVDSLNVRDSLIAFYLLKRWFLVRLVAGVYLIFVAVELGSLCADFIWLSSRDVGWFFVEDAAFVCVPAVFRFAS